MLTPDYLLRISEGGEEIAERIHQNAIKQIVDRIVLRLDRGDDYILTARDKWQLQTLQEAGYLLEDIQKEIAKETGLMQTEIAEAMEDAGVEALKYDDAIYRAAGLSPTPLEQSPHLIRLMQSTFEATMGDWTNFTGTFATAAQQSFVKAMDNAYTQVASGSMSYSEALVEAINGIVGDGVIVEYPSGHTDTIETATLRCIRTGVSQATGRIQMARMEEMGIDLVLVSSHLGARPEHAEWQGKVYSRSGNDPKYPALVEATGYGTVEGLCGANCRHNFGPWTEGMTNPFEDYDSEENQKAYETQQRQRTLERRIRKTKREVMGLQEAVSKAETPEAVEKLQRQYDRKAALLALQNAAYNDFCEENGLKKLSERITVAKWDRSQAAKARAAAKRYAKDHPDSVVPKEYKPRKQKRLIDTAQTTSQVEQAFVENDWFVHTMIDGKDYRSDSEIKLEGCDLESAKAAYRAYEKFFGKYPQMVGELSAPRTSMLHPEVFANCTMGFGAESVCLNIRHFRNFDRLKRGRTENVKIGFAPRGCEDPMTIVMHELGHALDGYLSTVHHSYGATAKGKTGWVSNKIRPIVLRRAGMKVGDIEKELSQYATETVHEWFAECFAEYMCSDNPRKMSLEFGKFLDEIMEGL